MLSQKKIIFGEKKHIYAQAYRSLTPVVRIGNKRDHWYFQPEFPLVFYNQTNPENLGEMSPLF